MYSCVTFVSIKKLLKENLTGMTPNTSRGYTILLFKYLLCMLGNDQLPNDLPTM